MTLLKKIRRMIIFFMIALVLSGITAFPAETELAWLMAHPALVPAGLHDWLKNCYDALHETNAKYPMLAYGYDWLAFAHLVIAAAFIGPYRDPVRNKWVINWAIIACLGVFPLAFIAGPIRQIPVFHMLIDCAFGALGLIPLFICKKWIKTLEVSQTSPVSKMGEVYSYLALGDSYTIGEAVLLTENFPYQTVKLLRNEFKNAVFHAPEIVAKTGWTTDELSAGIAQLTFLKKYDVVSLLIGVNNQYRGRSVEEFKIQLEDLLKQAIHFAGNETQRVFVLSIPDWGITPFAKDRNVAQIATDIDQYNAVCAQVSAAYKCNYINITVGQRADGKLEEFVAADGLHPSAKEYEKWAELLSDDISKFVIDG